MSVVADRKGMPDGWRSVPMPPGVAALPTTRSGIPITYTVAWSSEVRPVAREDPILRGMVAPGTMALFHSGAQGEGTPKLNVGSVDRVRRVTVLGLCQVCGRTLTARRPRWLCDLRNHGQEIEVGGRVVPLVVDGWSCEPCLRYGLLVCPGLLRRQHDDELRLLRVRSHRLVATIERVEGLSEPVIGWVKIAPLDFDVIDPAALLASAPSEGSER